MIYEQIMNVEQFQLSDLLIVGDVVPLVDKIMNKECFDIICKNANSFGPHAFEVWWHVDIAFPNVQVILCIQCHSFRACQPILGQLLATI